MYKIFFQGALVDSEHGYSESPEKSLHVSHAALDLNTLSNAKDSVQLYVRTKHTDTLIATLSKKIPQTSLVLAFEPTKKIKFFVVGTGSVALSGFSMPDENSESKRKKPNGSVTKNSTKVFFNSIILVSKFCEMYLKF